MVKPYSNPSFQYATFKFSGLEDAESAAEVQERARTYSATGNVGVAYGMDGKIVGVWVDGALYVKAEQEGHAAI